MSGPPFTRVLVANRGEIAVRVISTLRSMGIRSVAVYSDADRGARHVAEADEAVRIGPSEPQGSYLSIDAVIAAAKAAGVQAIHPGYGFLSERADFARACVHAGIVFVGPPAAVLEATGDKLGVKARVAKAGVRVIPGSLGEVVEGTAAFAEAAKATGFPMLLKAIGGGGGRGLRRVERASELAAASESARREAEGAFGDARLYAEALIAPARHVEVQVLGDRHGTILIVGDRDCSMQRRHQKVVEESPAPGLADEARKALHEAAATAAKALGYVNAGTCEFLVDAEGKAYFLEMNRRLQVEHPVTEAVFGIDLVAWQLRIAAGESLPPAGSWTPRGHAVEARVCAEDPENGFVPSPGEVLCVREPRGPGIRVDSGLGPKGAVTAFYDSLLMKVTAHAETRAEAIARLDAALAETAILGVKTNVAFVRRILGSAEFRDGRLSTDFLDHGAGRELAAGGDFVPLEAILAAAAADLLGVSRSSPSSGGGGGAPPARRDPWGELSGWRLGGGEAAR